MKTLELYIHIPFCVKKCKYCDFLSAPANEQVRISYMRQLVHEITARSPLYKEYQVISVFIGGGTPSIIEPDYICRVMDALYNGFNIAPKAEITIECNPGTLDAKKAYVYAGAGINRVSLGLQSADNNELKMLGRIHTYEEFLDSYNIIRNAGFKNVNIDLISALPGQTVKGWEETLRKTAILMPEHISAYSLIIEEGTPFYSIYGPGDDKNADSLSNAGRKNNPDCAGKVKSACKTASSPASYIHYPPLPDEDTDREIYALTKNVLSEYGFERYEISNYARPDFECRHNIGYWRRENYLGLGLGSASFIENIRFKNTSNLNDYLNMEFSSPDICNIEAAYEGKTGIYNSDISTEFADSSIAGALKGQGYQEIEVLDNKASIEEFMFLGLRMTKGISISEFYDIFKINIYDLYGQIIKELTSLGMIKQCGDFISLTGRGIDVSNIVLAKFLL